MLIFKKNFFTFLICFFIFNFVISQEVNSFIKSSDCISWVSIFRGIIGIFVLLFIAFLLSVNKKNIDWKLVGIGIFFQIFLAVGILKGEKIGYNIRDYRLDLSFIRKVFDFGGTAFTKILGFAQEGSRFLLADLVDINSYGFIFAFHVLPTIVFFSAITSLLFYLGIIQIIVRSLAKLFSSTMKISGIESLAVSGNIFLGQTEAPLMIKKYLSNMSQSEIFLVMTAGMATVAGGVLAAYISFLGGSDLVLQEFYARHLLAASVMAAPGAIVIAKIMFPQTEFVEENITIFNQNLGSNFLEAISIGTSEGLKLAVNVAAMLLVFIAMISLLNSILEIFGNFVGLNKWIQYSTNGIYNTLSLQYILGVIFSPIAYLIGINYEDTQLIGRLLGIKLAASEFIAYTELANLKEINNTIHFKYEKSIIMATYMLCGFANLASIGIQIGGIGILAPNQRNNLAKLGIKAVIAGSLASLVSSTIVGMLLG